MKLSYIPKYVFNLLSSRFSKLDVVPKDVFDSSADAVSNVDDGACNVSLDSGSEATEVAKKPRIALCLSGVVGGVKGKAGEGNASASEVLKLGYEHYKKHVIDANVLSGYDVDVFIHCWNVDMQEEIESLYKPTKSKFQEQVQFEVPSYVKGEGRRAFNHYSKWYSFKEVVQLKKKFEQEKGFLYDYVLVSRFDAAFSEKFNLKQYDPKYFYAARWFTQYNLLGLIPIYLRVGYPQMEYGGIMDIWFFSGSKLMNKFSELYDNMDEYTKPENCPMTRYGISNHNLALYHLRRIEMLSKLRFAFTRVSYWWFSAKFQKWKLFCGYGPKESTPLIRRKFFDCKK
jgi:hypothetical protein